MGTFVHQLKLVGPGVALDIRKVYPSKVDQYYEANSTICVGPSSHISTHSKPRTPSATGATDSKWRLNPQRPAGPGDRGSPVDAAASDRRTASSAGSTWARLRDLDPPRAEERCSQL
ncbi:hypothetical protein NDU88_010894 [Pleurodeles waltl]|uniref:Uncharacterized protein n=1 Tax=Pleurodeles waltl TaxID=8319 RepID=A0AAV7S368_PLEWA|nr:hypothetical protein NDU88_010894 [Pleurodeles waltl]